MDAISIPYHVKVESPWTLVDAGREMRPSASPLARKKNFFAADRVSAQLAETRMSRGSVLDQMQSCPTQAPWKGDCTCDAVTRFGNQSVDSQEVHSISSPEA